MNKEQVKNYLNRIGLESAEVTEEGLDRLIWAHLTHVPFENLDIIDENKIPSLEEADLYQKIVERHRGGYCFELNKLFYILLQELGFDVIPIGVRIVWQKPQLPPMSHRASLVRLNGKRYLADVGYGGPGPKGVLELTDREQKIRGAEFRITVPKENTFCIERLYQGTFTPMLLFEEKPLLEVDFLPMNVYCARYEKVIFSQRRIMSLCTDKGMIELNDRILRITENGQTREKELTGPEELKEIEETYFFNIS